MSRFERLLVWYSTIAVAATGFIYAAMKYLMQPVDEFAVVNHPLQPLVLKLHIVAAPVLVFALGMITMRHIWPNLVQGVRWARRSGLTTALVIIPMILTGYLIQAVTHVTLLAALAWSHLALGSIFGIGALAHAWVTRGARAGTLTFTRSRRGLQNRPPSAGGTADRWPARRSSRTGT